MKGLCFNLLFADMLLMINPYCSSFAVMTNQQHGICTYCYGIYWNWILHQQPAPLFSRFFFHKTFYIIYWIFFNKDIFDFCSIMNTFLNSREPVFCFVFEWSHGFKEKKLNWQWGSYFEGHSIWRSVGVPWQSSCLTNKVWLAAWW